MKYRAAVPVLIGAASAFLVPFGCGVDHRPSALTESDSAASSSAVSSGTGGAGGGTGGASGVGAGPSSPCACVAAAFGGDGNACSACLKKSSSAGRECESSAIECGANAACAPVVICLAACQKKPSASCIGACLYPAVDDEAHQLYRAFLACTCESCGSFCNPPDPVSCSPSSTPDAGPSDAAPGDASLDADDDGG